MDLSLLLLVFSLIFMVVSRLLLYNTIDKASRLKMKSFSTVRDTQRGSQSYMEKREEGDKSDQDEVRRNQKRRDPSPPKRTQRQSPPTRKS